MNLCCGIQPCKILLNELNAHTIKGENGKEFIELIGIGCKDTESLHSYLTLIVTEYNEVVRGPAVIFSADLQKQVFKHQNPKHQYFVIGGEKDYDLQFKDNAIESWTKPAAKTILSFFHRSGVTEDADTIKLNEKKISTFSLSLIVSAYTQLPS
uniref:Uncharacterized protein n=1 Tax=Panagrolaimus superbus TaxID=310955 RepID=A0A914Y392_9BILA